MQHSTKNKKKQLQENKKKRKQKKTTRKQKKNNYKKTKRNYKKTKKNNYVQENKNIMINKSRPLASPPLVLLFSRLPRDLDASDLLLLPSGV